MGKDFKKLIYQGERKTLYKNRDLKGTHLINKWTIMAANQI